MQRYYLQMKKRKTLKARRVHRRSSRPHEHYLIVVRSWMLVVLFAIMLGVGAVVGTYLNQELDQAFRGADVGDVAGVQAESR